MKKILLTTALLTSSGLGYTSIKEYKYQFFFNNDTNDDVYISLLLKNSYTDPYDFPNRTCVRSIFGAPSLEDMGKETDGKNGRFDLIKAHQWYGDVASQTTYYVTHVIGKRYNPWETGDYAPGTGEIAFTIKTTDGEVYGLKTKMDKGYHYCHFEPKDTVDNNTQIVYTLSKDGSNYKLYAHMASSDCEFKLTKGKDHNTPVNAGELPYCPLTADPVPYNPTLTNQLALDTSSVANGYKEIPYSADEDPHQAYFDTIKEHPEVAERLAELRNELESKDL
ncbi:hypothetical protein [Francisella hispaniensis]|uniref:Uncharacterized protein n=1 Tax=Francisella hispaniensis TaxID=622488 RepID=F4BH18_9GAMM|nr:hypothetical protein [Francisella hispaniensis]AEE26762.1 hypothetical protein FN3523_1459 [Francisella hispaniensis]